MPVTRWAMSMTCWRGSGAPSSRSRPSPFQGVTVHSTGPWKNMSTGDAKPGCSMRFSK